MRQAFLIDGNSHACRLGRHLKDGVYNHGIVFAFIRRSDNIQPVGNKTQPFQYFFIGHGGLRAAFYFIFSAIFLLTAKPSSLQACRVFSSGTNLEVTIGATCSIFMAFKQSARELTGPGFQP